MWEEEEDGCQQLEGKRERKDKEACFLPKTLFIVGDYNKVVPH